MGFPARQAAKLLELEAAVPSTAASQSALVVVHSCSEGSVSWSRGEAACGAWVKDVLRLWGSFPAGRRFMIGEAAADMDVLDDSCPENRAIHAEAEAEGALVRHSVALEMDAAELGLEGVDVGLEEATARLVGLPGFPPAGAAIVVAGAWGGSPERGCAAYVASELERRGYAVRSEAQITDEFDEYDPVTPTAQRRPKYPEEAQALTDRILEFIREYGGSFRDPDQPGVWFMPAPHRGRAPEYLTSGDPAKVEEATAWLRETLAKLERLRPELDAERQEQARAEEYESQGHEFPNAYNVSSRDLEKARSQKVWLYHGTSTALLPDILRDGLVPDRKRSDIASDRHRPGWIFLTPHAHGGGASAQWYADQAVASHGGERAILRVLVDGRQLERDQDPYSDSAARHQFKVGRVEPSEILEVNGVPVDQWKTEHAGEMGIQAQSKAAPGKVMPWGDLMPPQGGEHQAAAPAPQAADESAIAGDLRFEIARRGGGRWTRPDTIQVSVNIRLDDANRSPIDSLGGIPAQWAFAGQTTALETGGFAGAREDVAALQGQGFDAAAFWYVSNAWLDDRFRGQGVGRAMYDRLIEEIGSTMKGKPFFFGSQRAEIGSGTSRDADRVWVSLARRFPSSGQVVYVGAAEATTHVAANQTPRLYHGTPDEATARQIAATGKLARENQWRGQEDPTSSMAGRVYATSDLEEAIGYLCHYRPWSIFPDKVQPGKGGLVILDNAQDRWPDEDWLGALVLEGVYLQMGESLGDTQIGLEPDHVSAYFETVWGSLPGDLQQEIEQVEDFEDPSNWAVFGKRVIDVLATANPQLLVELGSQAPLVSMGEGQAVTEVWLFDRSQIEALVDDPEAIFTLGERLPVVAGQQANTEIVAQAPHVGRHGWIDPSGTFYECPPGQTHQRYAEQLVLKVLHLNVRGGDGFEYLIQHRWTRAGFMGDEHLFAISDFGASQRAAIESFLIRVGARESDTVTIELWGTEREWRGTVGEFYETRGSDLKAAVASTLDLLAAGRPPEGFFDPQGVWAEVTRNGGHARFAKRELARRYKGWAWQTEADLFGGRCPFGHEPVFALLSRGWMRISNDRGDQGVNVDVWQWAPKMKDWLEGYLLENRVPDDAWVRLDEQATRRFSRQTVAEFYEGGPGWYGGERSAIDVQSRRTAQALERKVAMPPAGAPLYHGCNGATARAIAADGFVRWMGGEAPKGKAPAFRPMQDRTYWSADPAFAMHHALGAHWPSMREYRERTNAEGGLVIVREPNLAEALPDEDWVGNKVLAMASFVRRGRPPESLGQIDPLIGRLWNALPQQIRDRAHQYSARGYASDYAVVGKAVNRWLMRTSSASGLLRDLVAAAPEVALPSEIPVDEVLVFDPHEVAPDVSNLREVATSLPIGGGVRAEAAGAEIVEERTEYGWKLTTPDGSSISFGTDFPSDADHSLGEACILYFDQGGDFEDEDDDGEVAGFVDDSGMVGYIGGLETGEKGQGWGRKLVERALEILRTTGVESVYVPAEPQSINFWGHMGFEDLGGEACHAMVLRLTPAPITAQLQDFTPSYVRPAKDAPDLQPWQMTQEEYLAAINQKGKWFSTTQIKTHALEPDKDAGEVAGFLGMDQKKSDYPILLFTRDHAGHVIEYRQNGRPQRYVKYDESDPNADELGMVRDPATGWAVMMSEEEMAAAGLAPTEQGVYAFEGETLVGWASDSWGAVEVYVAREYQRLGIGRLLARTYRSIFPWKDSGGQTSAGMAMAKANHRDMVQEALERGEDVPERVLAEYGLAPASSPAEPMPQTAAASLLYHVTDWRHAPAIRRKGLLPSVGRRGLYVDDALEPRVYLFTDRATAEDGMTNWLVDEMPDVRWFAVLGVEIPAGVEVHEDPELAGSCYVTSTIPPEAIRSIEKVDAGEPDEDGLGLEAGDVIDLQKIRDDRVLQDFMQKIENMGRDDAEDQEAQRPVRQEQIRNLPEPLKALVIEGLLDPDPYLDWDFEDPNAYSTYDCWLEGLDRDLNLMVYPRVDGKVEVAYFVGATEVERSFPSAEWAATFLRTLNLPVAKFNHDYFTVDAFVRARDTLNV